MPLRRGPTRVQVQGAGEGPEAEQPANPRHPAWDWGMFERSESDGRKLLLTVKEAARRLSLGRSHLYQLVMRGDIGSIELGRSRRIPVAALEWFVQERKEEEHGSDG